MSEQQSEDSLCICAGNWRSLVKRYEPLIDNKFKDHHGKTWTFFGLVHARDDFYYGFVDSAGVCMLSSCVGSLESFYDPA